MKNIKETAFYFNGHVVYCGTDATGRRWKISWTGGIGYKWQAVILESELDGKIHSGVTRLQGANLRHLSAQLELIKG